MVETAAALGWQAIGLADVNSLAGIVRAHVAARDHGIRLVVGARLTRVDGPEVIVHPTDRAGIWGAVGAAERGQSARQQGVAGAASCRSGTAVIQYGVAGDAAVTSGLGLCHTAWPNS